jgi:hypothetical protein
MALSSITDAINQYNANLAWNTDPAQAQLALQAVRYLLINRAQIMDDQGQKLSFESLRDEKAALEKFLGATSPRAFGRSRVNGARFCGRGGVE